MDNDKKVTSGESQKDLRKRIGELTEENDKLRNACFIPRAEKDTHGDNTLLASVMETSPVGIVTTDSKGMITYANIQAENILGLKRDQIGLRMYNEPAWHIMDLNGNPYPEERLPFPIVMKTGQPVYDVQHAIEWPDGKRIFLSINAAPLKDTQGRVIGMVSALQDITQRQIADRELFLSEERYRTLFTEMLEGFALHEIICDANGKPVDYRFLGINPAFERLTGLKAQNVVGKTVRQVLPKTESYWIENYGRVALTGQPISFENYSQDLDRHFSISAFCPMKGRFAVLFIDITERKRSEHLLTEEKERLAVTLRSIGDGVITTDIKGNVVLMNKAAESLTGWNSAEAAGKPLTEVFVIINELTRTACRNPVELVLRTGDIIELANHTCLIAKDGRERIIADSGAPIRDRESRIIGVVLVFRDMTEKQKLAESAQKAQKLESIGVLAGGIAHDFNNLLGGVFGYLEMAKESSAMGRPAEVQEYITKALGVYFRARSLTQQLLTFSKGGAPIRKIIPLTPVIRNSVQFALSGSNISCHFDIAGDLWLCDCDENQIAQVIDNIVINAKQAMPMGGKVVITASNTTRHTERDNMQITGNYVKISIKDEGIGMPRDILSRIFDPFFSTKETGHGLGLPTAYSILLRHDGWIDVESEPGKGSTFHLFLPATAQNKMDGTKEMKLSHNGTGTILVMDDEEFMLDILGHILKQMGYSILVADSGEQATGLFREAEASGSPITACILDLTIPGHMGGRETLFELRKIRPDAVIIASSGYSEDPVMSNPKDHGFTDKIIKPFRKHDLAELFSRVLKDR